MTFLGPPNEGKTSHYIQKSSHSKSKEHRVWMMSGPERGPGRQRETRQRELVSLKQKNQYITRVFIHHGFI